jgi:hypothetical protein
MQALLSELLWLADAGVEQHGNREHRVDSAQFFERFFDVF